MKNEEVIIFHLDLSINYVSYIKNDLNNKNYHQEKFCRCELDLNKI